MRFDEYLTYLKDYGKSPETVASYSHTYNAFTREFQELNTETAYKFLERYQNPATFNKALNHLRSYWNWAQRMGYSTGGLMIEQKKVPLRLPQTVDDDYYVVLDYLANNTIIGSQMTFCFVLIKKNTGMRFSEILNLRRNHFDSSGIHAIRFIGKGNAERIVTLNQAAFDAMLYWCQLGEKYGFPSSDTIRYHLAMAEQVMGVMHIRPHWIRHTVATKLDAQGVPVERVADLLGNTVEVVRSRYRRMNVEKLKEVTDLL